MQQRPPCSAFVTQLSVGQVMEAVAAAQEALAMLVPAGDYAGALDVLADLQLSSAPAAVQRLAAFQDLPQQLASVAQASNIGMYEAVSNSKRSPAMGWIQLGIKVLDNS